MLELPEWLRPSEHSLPGCRLLPAVSTHALRELYPRFPPARSTYRQDYDKDTDAIADQEMWRVGHMSQLLRPAVAARTP